MSDHGVDFQKTELKRELTRTLLHKFYLQAVLYAVIIIFLFGVGYVICAQRIWYENTPFYSVVHWLHEEWFTCFLVIFVLGLFFLTFRYFRKFLHILEYMMEEIEQMATEESENAELNGTLGDNRRAVKRRRRRWELPQEVRPVQWQMEQIRGQIEESRRIAKETERRKNDLIMYMAHDLKTPLTSVIGYLNLLADDKDVTAELQKKYAGIALHKAERLEELINEFFELIKLQLATMVLQKTTVNLGRMIEQIAFEFRPQLSEKGMDYALHLEQDLELLCDVDKIERVFDNLLKNAVHYSYRESTIHISAFRDEEGDVCIQVDNRGRTIPAEQRERLFEQFFRMDDSRASYSGGSGLGLAISKEIVQAHGGSITCVSEEEHICFRIVLPD